MNDHCDFRDKVQHSIPPRVIDRIFSGAVTRSPGGRRVREALETIAYTDFVAFLLAEEDKKHPTRASLTKEGQCGSQFYADSNIHCSVIVNKGVDWTFSIEYWFRVLDLDGDGFLSLYEMEYFYNGVKSKMDQHNIDSMRFDDVVCNIYSLQQRKELRDCMTLSAVGNKIFDVCSRLDA
uniref:EF-hand domain-containing protein n=1 Tax=Parascaris equorum TaxID=6256 RepID=A0A914SC68_PAREQ